MPSAREGGEAGRKAEAEATAAIRAATREEDAANVAIEHLDVRRTGLAERMTATKADLSDARTTLAEVGKTVAALPDAKATERRLGDLRSRTEAAQAALAEVRAEAATHARAVSADKQQIGRANV